MVESRPDSLHIEVGSSRDGPGESRDRIYKRVWPQSRYGASYPSSSPEFHDCGDISTPTVIAQGLNPTFTGGSGVSHSDAGRIMTDHPNPGSRWRSMQVNVQQSPQAPSSSRGYPASPSENTHPHRTPNFQGLSMPYANVPYGQRPGFVGQYTEPTPMPMVPTGSAYAFSPYHNTNVVPQPMVRPAGSHVYQAHPTDRMQAAPIYPTYQVNTPTPPSPHVSATQSRTLPPYGGTTPFQLQYPSPSALTTSFPFPHPFNPIFQPQYAHTPFAPPYSAIGSPDHRGAWFYLPHGAPASRPHGPHPPHVAVTPYLRSEHREVDSMHEPSQESPVGRSFSQYSGGQSSAGSPREPRATPPTPIGLAMEKQVIRHSYHPNPPANRSDWVMWTGNVPSDANHDELWRFFNQAPSGQPSNNTESGVVSIFLISRSNCAFVNYKSEGALHEAITRFNGVQLRPSDARCPRLVCRVRRLDDDLKAGVGGQRRTGMHIRWIKERKAKQREPPSEPSDSSSPGSPVSISERMARAISTMGISGVEHTELQNRRGVHVKHPSSSGSTNSSFLASYFPKRYFILKSLTQFDLDLSVQRGLWATQRHNEEILDQAFRTSKEVYLIFGVNKSGEFYGYAKMAGPVGRGDKRVSWASRSSRSSTSHSGRVPKEETFFSPSDMRLVDSSPLSISGSELTSDAMVRHSAPALLEDQYDSITPLTPEQKFSLDQRMSKGAAKVDIRLDTTAPQRAVRHQGTTSNVDSQPRLVETKEHETGGETQQPKESKEETWGDSFAVEWISTVRLPFHRTRQFRNPWNHEREVKVSRDGTELEPTVGQQLLDEWEKFVGESRT